MGYMNPQIEVLDMLGVLSFNLTMSTISTINRDFWQKQSICTQAKYLAEGKDIHQVTDACSIRLGQCDMTRENAFNGLTQLQVEGDDADTVDPGGETIPRKNCILQAFFNLFKVFHFVMKLTKITIGNKS